VHRQALARKGEKVVDANRRAFAAGREAVAKQLGAAAAPA